MKNLEAALKYQAKGFVPIPVKENKTPYIKWEVYQKERPTESQVREWWSKWPSANVAIVTGELSNILVIDTDTPEATDRVQELIPDSLVVPCQSTPSGGMHFLFSHKANVSNRARIADGIDVRTQGGYFVCDPSINGTGKGWKWQVSPLDADPPDAPERIVLLLNNAVSLFSSISRAREAVTSQQVTEVTASHRMFTHGTRDEDLFHIANQLVKTRTKPEVLSQVIEILAKNCDPPFPESEIQEKIKSAIKRAERKEKNITEDLREWVESQEGHWKVTTYHLESQIVTKEDKHATIMAIKRLQEQGVIKKYGNERGVYTRIEDKVEEINWENCDDTVVNVQWPFGLEKFYICLPKNIIVVAGSPDAGKTAFCLNFAQLNMERYLINYFSSEMGALELKSRLEKFPIGKSKWKRVKFFERSLNFADVIDPEGINIVDYIEVPEEAWKIVTPINEIFRRLTKGICIIALQKPISRDVARGGEGTLDRPRMYLSMGNNEIKIIKCKNWASHINPKRMSLKYKITQGCKFTQESEWGIPWEEVKTR